MPGDVEAVVEYAVGEEEPDQQDDGQPPGEEDESKNSVNQEQDRFQEEFHQESDAVAEGLVLDFAAKDFCGKPHGKAQDC